jgi:hypothetical protein
MPSARPLSRGSHPNYLADMAVTIYHLLGVPADTWIHD